MRNMTDEELVEAAREALRRGLLLPDLAASLCPGVIAVKTWCRDDIKVALQEKGFEGTEDEIDHVLSTSLVASLLGDPTDEDFEIINRGVQAALDNTEEKVIQKDDQLDQLVQLAIEKSEDGLQFEVYPVGGGALGLDVNGEPYTTPAESVKEIEDTINLLWAGFMFAKNAKPDPQFAEYDQRTLRPLYRSIDQEGSAEKAHDGQPFKVVRRLTWQECDKENRPMWRIRFDDGFETDAFPEEIYEEEKKADTSLPEEDAGDRRPLLTLPEKQFLTEIISKIDANVYGIEVSYGVSLTYIKIRWEEISGYCGETELPIIMPAFVYMEQDRWYEPTELGIGGACGGER